VGLFSFLKKKNDAPEARAPARPRAPAGRPAVPDPGSAFAPTTRMPLDTEADRERQREIARATAAKIDEIELQMTSDIFDDQGWAGNRRAPAVASSAGAPLLDLNTADLLVEEGMPNTAVAPSSAPAVEEAAILYANGQLEAAEAALRSCLDGDCRNERQPWWMLFDLYQASGREPAFESIAIDYASHFETSPPAYLPPAAQSASQPFSGVTPTATLTGQLDAAASAQLARVLASTGTIVRLEFSTIASATPEGCAALLAALQTLRRAGRELVVAGADHLVAVLRPMLAIGNRDAGEAPWLLLLELLLLLNREKDFEETAMDYCVTFEVSPPSFEAPARRCSTSTRLTCWSRKGCRTPPWRRPVRPRSRKRPSCMPTASSTRPKWRCAAVSKANAAASASPGGCCSTSTRPPAANRRSRASRSITPAISRPRRPLIYRWRRSRQASPSPV
jgi:hypothetical protein